MQKCKSKFPHRKSYQWGGERPYKTLPPASVFLTHPLRMGWAYLMGRPKLLVNFFFFLNAMSLISSKMSNIHLNFLKMLLFVKWHIKNYPKKIIINGILKCGYLKQSLF